MTLISSKKSNKSDIKNTEKIYIMMNKPSGYVCSAVSDSHKTVYELLPEHLQQLVTLPKRGEKLHTVGRLDCDTSGLLLFTTDGFFSHSLTSPEFNIKKTYLATLKQRGNESYIKKACEGLILPAEKKAPEQKSQPAVLIPLDKDYLKWQITVTEGKFHEVRRTFLALQNEVESLQRIRIGKMELPQDLHEGDFRYFNPQDFFQTS